LIKNKKSRCTVRDRKWIDFWAN